MTESVKEQLAADLQKVKSVGGERIDRIRKIFQEALSQTVSELKEGGTEVQSIAKDSSLAEMLKKPAANEANPEVKPVVVTIEDIDSVDLAVDASAPNIGMPDAAAPDANVTSEIITSETANEITDETIVEAILESTQQAKPRIAIVDMPVANSMGADLEADGAVNTTEPNAAEANTTEPTNQSNPNPASPLPESLQSILDRIMAFWNDEQTQTKVKPVLTKLNQALALVDRKLADRYGERYDAFKQEFHEDMAETKVWYNGVKAKAVETGAFWIDRKQAGFEVKADEAGATIAQKEQKIKQLLKELWQTVVKG